MESILRACRESRQTARLRPKEVGILLADIRHCLFLELPTQIQLFEPYQIGISFHFLNNRFQTAFYAHGIVHIRTKLLVMRNMSERFWLNLQYDYDRRLLELSKAAEIKKSVRPFRKLTACVA